MATTTIDVRPQHHIPLGKALRLCLKGISHRLFRSLLTSMVIVLAVAFFMSLLTESAVARSVGLGIGQELQHDEIAQRLTATWFDPMTPNAAEARLARALGHPNRLAELAAVSHLPEATVEALAHDSAQDLAFSAFFADLDAGTRAALVGSRKGADIDRYLEDPQAWSGFAENLHQLFVLRPPLPLDEMRQVVERHRALEDRLAAFSAAWQADQRAMVQDSAAAGLGNSMEALRDLLEHADAAQLARFGQILGAHGFLHDDAELALVHAQLSMEARTRQVRDALVTEAAKAAWRKTFLENPPLEEKMLALGRSEVPAILGNVWSHEQLAAISRQIRTEHRRHEIAHSVAGRLGGELDEMETQPILSERQAFLMAISFVVCMVGISNAMLMAITERFREIATMKCLGATDGFILQQFLIEAAMQGLAGGVAGMIIGALLSLLKCSVEYGGYLFSYFPVAGLGIAALTCIVAGVALSTLASIYPSWMASRMAPMEAMRIE